MHRRRLRVIAAGVLSVLAISGAAVLALRSPPGETDRELVGFSLDRQPVPIWRVTAADLDISDSVVLGR